MEFPLCYLIVIMKSITHLFFDRRLRNITLCSSVLKCRTIVSINTFTKENNRRREEITTRHLTLMNSGRGEPRTLLLLFTSSIEKKAVDREHHSSKGVHIVSCKQGPFVYMPGYTGCPKSSFLCFIGLYFRTIGPGKQIISTKVVSFNIIHCFHTCCAIF